MTPSATQWRGMDEAMSFPALVQWENGYFEIWHWPTSGSPIRWQPFIAPPFPKPKSELHAFEVWLRDNIHAVTMRHAWDGAIAYATEAERARFAAGVEKLIAEYDEYMGSGLKTDLRALAKGAASL